MKKKLKGKKRKKTAWCDLVAVIFCDVLYDLFQFVVSSNSVYLKSSFIQCLGHLTLVNAGIVIFIQTVD